MATVTFQDGGYFDFKPILLKNDNGDPQILFDKMISLSILNSLNNFKKILSIQNFSNDINVITNNNYFSDQQNFF